MKFNKDIINTEIMNILYILKKLRNAYIGAINGYKFGGIVKAAISEINYGGMFSEKDVVLVSGGSKGIGLEICKKLLKEGAVVIITGRDLEKLKEVKSNLASNRLYITDLDISKAENMSDRLNAIEINIGKPITALINNAGVYAETHFPNVDENDAMRVFTTNAIGTLILSQCMCKMWGNRTNQKPYKIINICSQGGFVGANNAYRMTKWGIRGLTEYMGKSLCSKNIIVNGVAPGIVLTDMQPHFKKQGDNLVTNMVPSGRIALPLEIAELVIFLLSDAANYIIGQTICCDGGYSLK